MDVKSQSRFDRDQAHAQDQVAGKGGNAHRGGARFFVFLFARLWACRHTMSFLTPFCFPDIMGLQIAGKKLWLRWLLN